MQHSALIDVPETESLGFKNLDDYRVMAGGRDMAGHTLLSCEAICYNGAAYNTTLGRQQRQPDAAEPGALHPQQHLRRRREPAMIHGFPYAQAPGVTWPGFAAFSPYYNGAIGFGEAWGPRTPQWEHMPDIAAYLARTQLVLQTGTPKYDVVFLRQKGWTSTGIGAFWTTNDGIPLGWTHSFATPALLDLAAATVRGGRLAPDGPAYKALIVGTDQFRGHVATMDIDGATGARARPRGPADRLRRRLVGPASRRSARGRARRRGRRAARPGRADQGAAHDPRGGGRRRHPGRARLARHHPRRRARATRPS